MARDQGALLGTWFEHETLSEPIAKIVGRFPSLPANPRKIKAFANTLVRFGAHLESGAAKDALDEDIDRACRVLVVVAYLYTYFPALYRRLEGFPRFITEIQKWVHDGYSGDSMLRGIRLPREFPPGELERPRVALEPAEEERQPTREGPPERFPDPGDPNVFWLQRLLADMKGEPITENEIPPFLLK